MSAPSRPKSFTNAATACGSKLPQLGNVAPPTEILLISDCESYEVPYLPKGMVFIDHMENKILRPAPFFQPK